MKTLRIFPLISFLFAVLALPKASFAQAKTETLKVSGQCGMCKKKIEKAAKDAGATYAVWNINTKILTIKYSSASTNTAKIQQKIAGVGYDTPDYKTTDEAYNKLDECCQYERSTNTKASCCKDGKCTKEGHDGKDCCKKSQ